MIEFVIEKLVEYPVLNIINHNISNLGNPYFSTGQNLLKKKLGKDQYWQKLLRKIMIKYRYWQNQLTKAF